MFLQNVTPNCLFSLLVTWLPLSFWLIICCGQVVVICVKVDNYRMQCSIPWVAIIPFWLTVMIDYLLGRSTQITSHRFPITFCHECWIDTEVMRLQMQVSKVSFQSLILHIERNQLVWLWHLTRMPPGNLSLEVFLAHPTWRESRVDPEHTKEIKQYMTSGLGRHPDPPEGVEGIAQ